MPKRKKSSNKRDPQVRSGTPVSSALPLGALAGVVLIAVAAVLVYLPALSGGFILDDDVLLTKNELIKASDGLFRFWCTTESPDYWPVTNTTFWIEWRLWKMNPTGYHVTNLILHIVESLLVWLILRKLSIPGAFLAALIFAVHPVNVESVAWIAQRKDMLAMLFFLLSILCYLKMEIPSSASQNAPAPSLSPIWYWLSLGAFVLAMLSKGSVAMLPVLLLGIVWWLRPLTMRDLMRTAPFFVIAVVLAGVNVWFQTHGEEIIIRTASFAQRLSGAGAVVWFYLYKALLPLDLLFVYPQWNIQAGNPLWWLPLCAALAITAVLWQYRNRWSRPFLFAWGFFCVALAPVMGFADVGFMQYSLVADHYQHIAIIGVIALAAAGWSVWHQRTREVTHHSVTLAAIVTAAALTFLTYQQSGFYRDAITLYQVTLEKNPNSWMAHNNLGIALSNTGRMQEAIDHYQQAMLLDSDHRDLHNNLGNVFLRTGRFKEAIEHYQRALQLEPYYPMTYNHLGIVLMRTGQTREAIEYYQQALRIKPNYPEAHYNLGIALMKVGRLQDAIEHFEQALRLDPDYIDARNNLGGALVQAGRFQEAIEHYRQVLRLQPDLAAVYYNMALAYAGMQQSTQAVAAALKALELAQSQGQTALAEQIEDWLNSHRPGTLEQPNTPSPSKSSFPPP